MCQQCVRLGFKSKWNVECRQKQKKKKKGIMDTETRKGPCAKYNSSKRNHIITKQYAYMIDYLTDETWKLEISSFSASDIVRIKERWPYFQVLDPAELYSIGAHLKYQTRGMTFSTQKSVSRILELIKNVKP